jgi:hypothetical protein
MSTFQGEDSRGSRRKIAIVGVAIGTALAIAVVGATLLPALRGSEPSGDTSIASVLTFGTASRGVCPPGSLFATDGCESGHYRYVVPVASSTAQIEYFWLKVTGEYGNDYTATGALGFSILNASGGMVAQASVTGGDLSMAATNASWHFSSGNGNTSTTVDSDTIEIDVGAASPPSALLEMYGTGFGIYDGTTSAAYLP